MAFRWALIRDLLQTIILHQDDDDTSFCFDGDEYSSGVDTRQESPRNSLGQSQSTWDTEVHGSPRDSSPANGVSQSDIGVSSSENDSDDEGVGSWDNNSDSLEDEQLLDSFSSSEEDSE
ncbi:uncharacterized protein N7487_007220 [Penicillium crustosum]|uniref:uncharacterized protein n=1 Tax=Penicillium crustosum TaxID=36656 RepID=UPI00239440B5|nr:uncharacterized protein N7487_007220 [Penicillium crustosum]KAJ5401324.1 hypothetical protein N7487_007220 [Penicillium crustosum]